MRIPALAGIIKRRMLVNYRADPAVVQRLLPPPFRPKLHAGRAMVGVCLIRLEHIRPAGWPERFGLASENAAHRIAVEWTDDTGAPREGVFIPRRDTSSRLNYWAGGRLFPGEHHFARFDVADDGTAINFHLQSDDGAVQIEVVGTAGAELPAGSCFDRLAEASAFFESGSIGYSVTRGSARLDGLQLQTQGWPVAPLQVTSARSSYFEDPARFPPGSVEFDHALIMRNVPHRWHKEADLHSASNV